MYSIMDAEVVKVGVEHWIEISANSVWDLQQLAMPLGLGMELKNRTVGNMIVMYPVDGDITRMRIRRKK